MAFQQNSTQRQQGVAQPRRHVCSIIPPLLLTDILEREGHSDACRAAITKTLEHSHKLHEHRELKSRYGAQNFLGLLSNDGVLTAARKTSNAIHRSIYDSNRTNKLRKKLLFQEGGNSVLNLADADARNVVTYFDNAHEFFRDVFKRNSIDDKGLYLIGSVHYDDVPGPPGMDNAFWDGDEMAFGDGDGELFGSFTKNLDVIGHELTHGVTQYEANLDYEFQSGALNESISDVFGSMIKQYFHPDGKQLATNADWLIGEGIFQPTLANAAALRSMKAPGTAYNNPKIGKDRQGADMDSYQKLPNSRAGDWGGVHINSGIPNHAFYLVATSLGGYSWEQAGQIWYASLRDPGLKQIDTKTAFTVFADLTTKYALELFDEKVQAVVKDAWTTVKVYPNAAGNDTAPGGEDTEILENGL